jgi:alkanesulfonate monooxygenase SsuD/methylene tetrahydromethanopterin reductase-like flavin-dependent oxidoreductase (luciferase family)
MRVGVLLLPTDPWPVAVEQARRLEALGYDHLWTYDHLSWRRYRDHPWFNAVPWLTGIAAATTRVRLGTMVAAPTLRHPLPFAQEITTLDHVSDGRFVLGLGAGGSGFDATVLGAELPSPGARATRFAEFVDLLDRLLREHEVTHRGAYYTVDDAHVYPACVQQPRVPFAIAATGPKSLALAARTGAAWITWGDPSDRSPTGTERLVRAQVEQLDAACAAIGRDPSTIERVYLIGNTEERPLVSLEAFRDFVDRYAALGFTDVVFHHPRPDDPVWNEPPKIVEEIAADLLAS